MRIELRIFNPDLRSRVREILEFTQSTSVSNVVISEADAQLTWESVVDAPDVLITDAVVIGALAPQTRLVRLGVDVRIPGEEAHLLRIVESAHRGYVFPVYVFSGLSGGVGTTTAALQMLNGLGKLDLEHLFVLDLVDDMAIRFQLAQDRPTTKPPTILSWDEVTIDDDVVTARIPRGLLAVLPSHASGPPAILEIESLVGTLAKVGPTVIDAGRFHADTVQLCQSVGAHLVLVGHHGCNKAKSNPRGASKDSDYPCQIAKARLDNLGLDTNVTWLGKKPRSNRRARKLMRELASESVSDSRSLSPLSIPGEASHA